LDMGDVRAMASVTVEPTWSYREAAKILGHIDHRAVSAIARAHGVSRAAGKPLDTRGLKVVAKTLGIDLTIARSA
jgi:4-hydroxy-3-methylbut-2-enyl diphosphate reductase IspH